MSIKIPSGLRLWTADQCAECLPVSMELYSRLWRIVSEAKTPTPLGGDGSNGTVECPEDRLTGHNDDKAQNFWKLLTDQEQQELTSAYEKL